MPAEPPGGPPIRILIVDDSAFARKVVREILSRVAGIDVVGSARNGEEALVLTAELNPDLVICDLNMPSLNGVEFVRQQMRLKPLPILILSAASQDAVEVIDALSAGAVDVVRKPSAMATDDLRAVQDELLAKVWAAAGVTRSRLIADFVPTPVKVAAPHTSGLAIVVIGISTGGPQALRKLIPMLAADFPVPIAVVLHMPVGYTALYAEKLNELSGLEVKEAHEGDVFRPGRMLLAQAGRHLEVKRAANGTLVAHLTVMPLEKVHRPSVDVLFRSAAEECKEGVLAVVMTGMGDDGKEGCAWVKAHGGAVLTEAEKSCVIYGMPRSVVEAGLSDLAVPLDQLAQAITSRT